jgi:type III HopA1-like effector protein
VSRYRDEVAAALRAVRICGPTQYAWLGRRSRPLPAYLAAELAESEGRDYLVACLREELYCSFYCYGRPVPARWGEPEPSFADRRLLAAMSQANSGRGSWEPGWTVQSLDGELAVVASARLRARLPVDDCRASSGAVRPGAVVSVRVPNELPELSPGFYTVVSDAPQPAPSGSAVRVYWNVTRTGAAALVGTLTSRLNGEGLPFRLKVANHPYRLQRCDAAVLYLRDDVFRAVRVTLTELAATLAAQLGPNTPAFTLELTPGVGLAEDPADGESFGVRRCAMLADGIVRAHARGITDLGARIDAVAERLAEDGVRIDAPYLEPALEGCHVL